MKRVAWVSAVLLTLSVAGVSLGDGASQRSSERGSLSMRLGLNEEQVERLRALRLEQRKSALKRHADMRALHLDLHALLAADTLDEQALHAKTEALAQAQATHVRARVEAQLALRKLLTPEQIERWREEGGRGWHERRHERGARFEQRHRPSKDVGDDGGQR